MNDIAWHDALIKEIQIDRRDPGNRDVINFIVQLYDGPLINLTFFEVFWANFNLNMGMVVSESILDFSKLEPDNIDLKNFYSKWKGMYDRFELDCYLLELNATGSTIKIIAGGIKITEYKS